VGHPMGGWQQLPSTAEASLCCGTDNDMEFIKHNYFKFSRVCPKPLRFNGKLSISSGGE